MQLVPGPELVQEAATSALARCPGARLLEQPKPVIRRRDLEAGQLSSPSQRQQRLT